MHCYLYIVLCLLSVTYGSESESKCYSRFDYDEKMLLKQLRLEEKVSKFDDEVKTLKMIMESEQTKRAELFENEMDEYRNISAEENLRQLNVTKMLTEAVKQAEITLNGTVQNFTEVLNNELKEIVATLDSEHGKLNESFNNGINELLERTIAQDESHALLIEKVKGVVDKAETDFKMSLAHQETLVKEVIERVDKAVAMYRTYSTSGEDDLVFTVTTPGEGLASSSLIFTKSITNEKNGYDTTTGIFTCPVSGLYYFSLHLVKKNGLSADESGCYIKVNRTNIVRAFFEPSDNYEDDTQYEVGSYGISTSMFVKLEADDKVMVGDCSTMYSIYNVFETFEPWSSFSGHLIRPYVV